MHRFLKLVEPWGVGLSVIALALALFQFGVDRNDREEDRVNRALSQFYDGIGRLDALNVLVRNDVDLRQLGVCSG